MVGTKVVVEAGGRKRTQFAKGGGSYLSANDRRHVFGLGTAAKIDKLTVVWSSGNEQSWTGEQLAADRYHRLEEK